MTRETVKVEVHPSGVRYSDVLHGSLESGDPLSGLMQRWAGLAGVSQDAVVFRLEGKQLTPNDTPEGMGWTAEKQPVVINASCGEAPGFEAHGVKGINAKKQKTFVIGIDAHGCFEDGDLVSWRSGLGKEYKGQVAGFAGEFVRISTMDGKSTVVLPSELKLEQKYVQRHFAPIEFEDAADASVNKFLFCNGRMEYWSDHERALVRVASAEVVSTRGDTPFHKVILMGQETEDSQSLWQWDMKLQQSDECQKTVDSILQMFAATRESVKAAWKARHLPSTEVWAEEGIMWLISQGANVAELYGSPVVGKEVDLEAHQGMLEALEEAPVSLRLQGYTSLRHTPVLAQVRSTSPGFDEL